MGHPYDRKLQLSDEQRAWIFNQRELNSLFVIVDEGPGRSGSTFLSVVEALVGAGIARDRIVMIGSHLPDASSLCASNAVERWRALNFLEAKRWACRKYEGLTYLGAGEWRKVLVSGAELSSPACWPQMERLKFLSADGTQIIKFEGMGAQGENVRHRAHCLAEAKLGPQFDQVENGFLNYWRLAAAPYRRDGISTATLERLAKYCAFRVGEFRAQSGDACLAAMVNFNLSLEFGDDIRLPPDAFETSSPVITDSKMHPHEWICDSDGSLIKTDGVSHGDDHFFPGPADIAWDLAGASIEWRLSPQAEEQLLSAYQKQAGENARSRFLEYKIAYATFRLAWCRMAQPTTVGTLDEAKLLAEIDRHRDLLSNFLQRYMTNGRAQTRFAA